MPSSGLGKTSMKNIPNIITITRIILSIILLFLMPLTPIFFVVYSICGLSDMFDGYIARKTNSTSDFGSMLDSIADVCFMSIVIVTLFPFIKISSTLIIWIILIALVRIISLSVVYAKFHTFAFLHTYANKLTGFLLFLIPYLIKLFEMHKVAIFVCIIASLATVEELIIILKSKELKRDIRRLRFIRK
jgi:phosphatidylglycerophosphate synthase